MCNIKQYFLFLIHLTVVRFIKQQAAVCSLQCFGKKCLILTFIVLGVLGELDLAAQQVMLEVAAITFMVCIIQSACLLCVASVLIASFPSPALSHSCLVSVSCRTPVPPPLYIVPVFSLSPVGLLSFRYFFNNKSVCWGMILVTL